MKKLSIVLATYNGELYLAEQLDSILNQTIPFDELIISDDVSTDRTWMILEDYAQRDKRIKLYRNNSNLGFLKNFEKALSYSTGDLIALSDQDDIWIPNHLQLLLEGIGNKILAVGDAEIINSEGIKLGYKLSYSENLDFIPNDDLEKAYFILYYRNPYQGASMLIHRDFLNIALPIPKGVEYHDAWFSFLACFCGGFQFVDEIVTLYRRHSHAVSGLKTRKTKIRTLLSHLLLNRKSYRPLMVMAAQERIRSLNKSQKDFLMQAEAYYDRRNTFCGRIHNFFFDLRYYKLIYGCK